jgi:hypothetical protein
MNSDTTHLTEDERQQAADGTLAEEQRRTIDAHLAECGGCAADVARIATFMKRIHDRSDPSAPVDELWPSIRARIEQTKVVPLATDGVDSPRETRWRVWWLVCAGAAAALFVTVFALHGRRPVGGDTSTFAIVDSGAMLVSVVDSTYAYEREARILLDKLELQRAMLRPDAAKALEHDLRVVDVAIAELKDAVARDPANPALRQLLAASYRQKVDLLKRAGNAG